MKTILVTTKDTVTGECTTAPQMYRNEGEAKRAWGNAIAELSKNNPTNVPIRDLQLYKIADFDTETLEVTRDVKFLASGPEYIVE